MKKMEAKLLTQLAFVPMFVKWPWDSDWHKTEYGGVFVQSTIPFLNKQNIVVTNLQYISLSN